MAAPPRRPGDTTRSIMLAAYPIYSPSLDDPASESAYELILSVSKGIRSLVAEYAIKDGATLTIQLFNPTAHATCTDQLPSIRSLAGKGVASIHLLPGTDPKPQGCVPFAVSSAATVFLLVKGHVDIEAEIAKAQRKLERAVELVKKQNALLQDEAYQRNVGADLQEIQRKKLRDAEAEVREMQGSVIQFERLRLE